MKKLNAHSETFIGRRSNNQDACDAIPLNQNSFFLVVADGMGGSVGGQIASALVMNESKKILVEEFQHNVNPEELKPILERVFISAQSVIAERIKSEPDLTGMGTTLTCVLIQDDHYVWGNLGDSRVYLLRNDAINQITVDHTYVQDFINESNGKDLPQSVLSQYGNYLVKSIDGGKDEADIFPREKPFEQLQDNDIFMLCSDGLITNKTGTDTTIFKDYIQSAKTLQMASEQLIAFAFYTGSKDNISVVLAEVGEHKAIRKKVQKFAYPPTENVQAKPARKFQFPKLSSLVGALAIIVAFTLGYLLFFDKGKQDETTKLVAQNIPVQKQSVQKESISAESEKPINFPPIETNDEESPFSKEGAESMMQPANRQNLYSGKSNSANGNKKGSNLISTEQEEAKPIVEHKSGSTTKASPAQEENPKVETQTPIRETTNKNESANNSGKDVEEKINKAPEVQLSDADKNIIEEVEAFIKEKNEDAYKNAVSLIIATKVSNTKEYGDSKTSPSRISQLLKMKDLLDGQLAKLKILLNRK